MRHDVQAGLYLKRETGFTIKNIVVHENRLLDMGCREDRGGDTNGDGSMEAYTLPYIKQTADGNLVMTQETQTRAL